MQLPHHPRSWHELSRDPRGLAAEFIKQPLMAVSAFLCLRDSHDDLFAALKSIADNPKLQAKVFKAVARNALAKVPQ